MTRGSTEARGLFNIAVGRQFVEVGLLSTVGGRQFVDVTASCCRCCCLAGELKTSLFSMCDSGGGGGG